MTRLNISSIKVTLISTLLVVGLMTNTAKADRYNQIVAPLAAFVLFNSLIRHSHGFYSGAIGHRHGYKRRYNRRGFSHSNDGYSYRPKRKSSRRSYSH